MGHGHSTSAQILLGRTPSGAWVVRDLIGAHAGIFRTREAALRFVRVEFGDAAPGELVEVGQLSLTGTVAA
jgi:hypothetical protein